LFELKEQRRYLKAGRKYKGILERMEAGGCPNATPLVAFLTAQETSLGKKRVNEDKVRDAFERGIGCMARHQNNYLEALLNERAGFDFAVRNLRSEEAEEYFARALYLYEDKCGARAKYDLLTQLSSEALKGLKGGNTFDGHYGKCISVPSTAVTSLKQPIRSNMCVGREFY
jgi:hypothetical protein